MRIMLVAFLAALLAVGCSDEPADSGDVCEAGDVQDCTCGTLSGTQTCNLDGTGWESCECQSEEPSVGDDDGGTVEDSPGDVDEVDAGDEGDPEPEIDAGGDPGSDPGADEEADASTDAGTDAGADPGGADDDPEDCPATPPLKPYSGGVCPIITGGNDLDPDENNFPSSLNTGFMSAGASREFRFIIPSDYDPTREYPLLIGYHWINGSSRLFIRDGEMNTAAEEFDWLIVLPDSLKEANGDRVYTLDWPFGYLTDEDDWEPELTFFDDLLTCISEQYLIDRCRVYGAGVSAGALWMTFVSTTERVDSLASVVSLSGGLGQVGSVWQMTYAPQANKYPAVVLWGGSTDWFIINFEASSERYRDELIADNHFVISCTHDSGHGVPPMEPPCEGCTRFGAIWQFFADHPYGLPAGYSPYQATGLPEGFPDWCEIATP